MVGSIRNLELNPDQLEETVRDAVEEAVKEAVKEVVGAGSK